jgi:HSP20 family protein
VQNADSRFNSELAESQAGRCRATGIKSLYAPAGEINSIFNSFFDDFALQPFQGETSGFTPCTDIRETDKEYIVECELPGLDEKDVEIDLNSDVLTLHGEKKAFNEEKRGEYHCIERMTGRFERHLPLPADVDREKITAAFNKAFCRLGCPSRRMCEAPANEF